MPPTTTTGAGASGRGAAGTATASRRSRRVPRRQQILEVAAPLFARRGFHGVSVDDLGAANGVSGPALYRHFASKEAILSELLVGVSERLLAGGRERAAAAADPAAALDSLIEWHVEFALDNADVISVQTRDLASLPKPERRQVRTLQQRYVEVWADVIAAVTGCGAERAVAAAHAAFGLINSTPHSARLPRADMVRLLRDMALGAVHAADEAPTAEAVGAVSERRSGRGS